MQPAKPPSSEAPCSSKPGALSALTRLHLQNLSALPFSTKLGSPRPPSLPKSPFHSGGVPTLFRVVGHLLQLLPQVQASTIPESQAMLALFHTSAHKNCDLAAFFLQCITMHTDEVGVQCPPALVSEWNNNSQHWCQ